MPVATKDQVEEIYRRFKGTLIGWHLFREDAEELLRKIKNAIDFSTEPK